MSTLAFTQGTPIPTSKLVGFDEASPGGERNYLVGDLVDVAAKSAQQIRTSVDGAEATSLVSILVGINAGIVEGAYRLVKEAGLPNPINGTWTLYASTATTSAGERQRPTNYDGSTNAFVWYKTA